MFKAAWLTPTTREPSMEWVSTPQSMAVKMVSRVWFFSMRSCS